MFEKVKKILNKNTEFAFRKSLFTFVQKTEDFFTVRKALRECYSGNAFVTLINMLQLNGDVDTSVKSCT